MISMEFSYKVPVDYNLAWSEAYLLDPSQRRGSVPAMLSVELRDLAATLELCSHGKHD